MLKFGIDLDNTIIDYDLVFKKVLIKKKINFDKRLKRKNAIKKYFHKKNMCDDFTILQGKVYGEFISEAKIFKGFKKFLNECIKKNIKVYIISHKSKYPILGKKILLRNKAKKFLLNKGLLKNKIEKLIFCDTIKQKIKKINELKLNLFIDDLEIILQKIKSKNTKKILFNSCSDNFISKSNWDQIRKYILKEFNL